MKIRELFAECCFYYGVYKSIDGALKLGKMVVKNRKNKK